MLPRTRLSLLYLAGYLIPSGIALLVAPHLTLKLLFSNGDYGDALPRLLGAVLIVLGVIIAQIIRLRLALLYTTAIATRLLLLATLVGLYVSQGDPLFLVLFGIVAFGVLLTSMCYVLDRRSAAATPKAAQAATPSAAP